MASGGSFLKTVLDVHRCRAHLELLRCVETNLDVGDYTSSESNQEDSLMIGKSASDRRQEMDQPPQFTNDPWQLRASDEVLVRNIYP